MPAPCTTCQDDAKVVKNGFFRRPSDRKKVQRYICRNCRINFSDQSFSIDYRHRKRRINQTVFRLLCIGVSQRACAFILEVKPEAIARRVERFGEVARVHLARDRASRPPLTKMMFDELETFEHTKCKPLTVPIVVEEKTRKIIALSVGQIAAKGKLAAIARKKYGPRRCERRKCLDQILEEVKVCVGDKPTVKTDQSRHYPLKIKQHLPDAVHIPTKGRRGCVVGQGELKGGGFDPLFSLNHTYAMFRDHLKRLTRRTWCTTKRKDRLENLLYLYAYFHNEKLEGHRKLTLRAIPIHN